MSKRGNGGAAHPGGLFPVPGDGVLARRGNLILLCSLNASQLVYQLLDLLDQAADVGSDGRQFTSAVADTVEAADDGGNSVLAFGPAGAGLAVTISGSAWAEVTTAHGTARVEAPHPSMLLRSVLRTEVNSVRGGLSHGDDGAASTDRFSRLDAGTVRAGGLSFYLAPPRAAAAQGTPGGAEHVLEPTEAWVPEENQEVDDGPSERRPTELWTPPPQAGQDRQPADLPEAGTGDASDLDRQVTAAPEPIGSGQPGEPAEPYSSGQPFEAVLLNGAPGDGPDAGRREPLAKADQGAAGTGNYVSAGPIIQGVYCKNGHFDDPEAQFCSVCGVSMNEQTLAPRPGERPPLGVLLLDDGSVFQLDSDYVIGREPSLDSSVADGQARALRVTDESGIVSRVHARVALDGWRVLVIDLGSANGTRVFQPGQQADQQLVPHVPMVLAAGSEVDLGGRGFRYESHRGR